MNYLKSWLNHFYVVAALLLVTLLLATACSGPVADTTGGSSDDTAPLTEEALKNAEYRGIYKEAVRLTDGAYEGEPFVEGAASRPTVTFVEPYAFGDLDGDGVEDAVVVLVENSGGSGNFRYLAAVLNRDGSLENVATQLLGDRAQVQTVTIDAGKISVNMVTHGPDDPLCCPSQEVTVKYRLSGEQLVEVARDTSISEEPTATEEPVASLEDTQWTLVSYVNDQGDAISVLPDAEITAEFTTEKVAGSAGCNQYFASYEVDGNRLSFGPIGSTMMACGGPLDEQERQYLAALESAASYQIVGDQLQIVNSEGETVLMFKRGEPATATDDMSWEALANLEYASEFAPSGMAPLSDGEYREPVAPGSATETVVKLTEHIAYGELNGQPAAVVVLVTDPGGSGTFYNLAIVMEQDGALANVASTFLGDRARIRSLTIEKDQIVVDMVTHGPDDPLCCPTQIVRDTYALEGETLVEVASEVIGSAEETSAAEIPAELLGTVWQWQQYVDMAGIGDITVDDPAKYTLKFLSDGTYQVVADCNRSGGRYVVDDSSLILEPGPTTLAECGPDSLYSQFLSRLGDVVTFVLEDGKLFLNLKMDAGDVVFASETEAGAPGIDITGIVWKWEGTTTPIGVTAVDDPDKYTIELLPDGQFRFTADCNTGSGTYTLDGGHISFEFGPMTLAACPPGSLSDQFIQDLSAAAIYFVEGDNLFIDLIFDSGTMRFAPGG
jgi:heat shock protein HslJ